MFLDRVSALIDRSTFPRAGKPAFEARKVAQLRIAVGLLLFWRCALITRDARFFFEPTMFAGHAWPLQSLAGAAQGAMAVCLVLGLLPRSCALLLLLTHAVFSAWTITYNLGPMLIVPLLGAVAVLDTGEMAIRLSPRAPLPSSHYHLVYVILFLCYAALSFQALVSFHLHDSYWTEGRTVAAMCTNSYLGVFYKFFRTWEVASPRSLWVFSSVGVLFQSLFQLAMLPMMLVGWGVRFVRTWGWIFILASLAELRLSILPLVEVVYWSAIFIPAEHFPFRARPRTIDEAPGPEASRRSIPLLVFVLTYALFLLVFIAQSAFPRLTESGVSQFQRKGLLFYAGLVTPNVFNQEDLKMGDHWAVIERLDGEKTSLVPFNGMDGERLSYHASDLIYFGDSLLWRRKMIGVGDMLAYHQPHGKGYAYARQIALYDFKRIGAAGPKRYRVTIYQNHASEVFRSPGPAKYAPEQAAKFVLVVGDAGT